MQPLPVHADALVRQHLVFVLGVRDHRLQAGQLLSVVFVCRQQEADASVLPQFLDANREHHHVRVQVGPVVRQRRVHEVLLVGHLLRFDVLVRAQHPGISQFLRGALRSPQERQRHIRLNTCVFIGLAEVPHIVLPVEDFTVSCDDFIEFPEKDTRNFWE